MPNWKFPDTLGFCTLINFIKQTEKASNVAVSGVSSLREDIQGLTSQAAQTFEQIDEALVDMEGQKLDKTNAVTFSILTSGWGTDNNIAGYSKYYDIAVTGVTEKDRAEITIAPSSLDTAKACGLCPTNQTLAGKIRVRAASIPIAAIAAEYWIENGKE